jgi:glyoxylase-like metal-dependent hydrolase (beta-lactamase superfamily II)
MAQEHRYGPVLFIPGINGGRYPYCNSIYVKGPGILIDPASDRERLSRLKEEEEVKQVWLTHFHEDHIMHLDLFDDVPLYVSEEDADKLADLDSFMESDWFELEKTEKGWWEAYMNEHIHFKPRTPAGFLRDHDVSSHEGATIEAIHSPGHTSGSLSFFIQEPGVLFLGDYDLTKFGPYYGNRESSIADTIASIDRLRRIPARVLLTGHEEGIFENPPDDIWDRYLDVIYRREKKLLEFLRSPRTFHEIVGAHIVYGKQREPKAFFDIGERALMKKHLEFLLDKNLIRFDGNVYYRK